MANGGALIGALRVSLGLDSSQFEAGTKRAKQVAKSEVSEIQKVLSGVKNGLTAVAGAVATVGLLDAAKRALDYASSLGEVAQQLGVTTRDLQVYRFIATQVGVDQDAMDASLAKLTRTMGEADAGSKKQATAFRDLGVSLKDANGNLLTAGEIMPRLADALSRIKDPATRAKIEVDLLGKSGQKLDTLLSEGSGAINDMAAEAERLGLVLGEDLIKKSDDAADRLSVLSQVLQIQVAKAVADNTEFVFALADALIMLVVKAGEAVVALREFGYNARQALNSAVGWSPFGGPAAGESARKSRADYFFQSLAKDERDAAAKSQANTARNAIMPAGALPSAKGGGGSSRRRSGGGQRDRTQDYLERYEREMSRLQEEELDQRAQMTADVRERAMFEHQRLNTTQDAYLQDVANREKSGELTKAQAEALRLQSAENQEREHAMVNRRLDAELAREELDLRRAAVENTNELLNGELDAARTQAERRRLQLQILDNERMLERFTLEQVEANKEATDAEKEIARRKLAQLDQEYSQRAEGVRRDTMSPMETYLNDLPRTADELREKFESIKVDTLNRGLDMASANVLKLKGAAGELFNQLIADVIRLNIQSALTGGAGGILGKIGNFLGLAGGLKATAGETAAINTVIGAGGFRLPGFAGGGSFRVNGKPGIDSNMLAINGVPVARVSHNENVSVGYGSNDNAGGVATIVPSPYFDVVVDGRAAGVAGGIYKNGAQANARRGRQSLVR